MRAINHHVGHRRPPVWVASGGTVALVVMAVTLCLGGLTKAPCLLPSAGGGLSRYCYSDIAILFRARGLYQHIFPYVHGRFSMSGTGNVFMSHGELEYPVLTGLLAWLASLPSRTAGAFIIWNGVLIIPCCLRSVHLLRRMVDRRAFFFAAAPAAAFYALLNWDAVAVAAAVVGIYLWWRRMPIWAAIALSTGACFKLWPGLMLLPLLAELGSQRRWARALLAGGAAAAVAVAVNAPFAVLNWRGWTAPFVYQSARPADMSTNSIWYWDLRFLRTAQVNVLSWSLVAVGLIAVLVMAARRARREGEFPFIQACAVAVLWYLLANKVYSPQYDLWVLPFFALLPVRKRVWVSFYAADACLYGWWLLHPSGQWLLAAVVFWRAAAVMAAMRECWSVQPCAWARSHAEVAPLKLHPVLALPAPGGPAR